MAFDPDRFEEKYVYYLDELEHAYRSAFEYMNDRYDSDLVHAIDQQVLNQSEPVYEGDGSFRVVLPDDPIEQLDGVLATDEKINATLDVYVDRLEADLARVFGFDSS